MIKSNSNLVTFLLVGQIGYLIGFLLAMSVRAENAVASISLMLRLGEALFWFCANQWLFVISLMLLLSTLDGRRMFRRIVWWVLGKPTIPHECDLGALREVFHQLDRVSDEVDELKRVQREKLKKEFEDFDRDDVEGSLDKLLSANPDDITKLSRERRPGQWGEGDPATESWLWELVFYLQNELEPTRVSALNTRAILQAGWRKARQHNVRKAHWAVWKYWVLYNVYHYNASDHGRRQRDYLSSRCVCGRCVFQISCGRLSQLAAPDN